MTWNIRLVQNRIEIGERFALSFQRTLRIPDDGKAYPLPPTLGTFPLRWVSDFAARLPQEWSSPGEPPALFIPMYQREALWLAFEAASWKPSAVKIGIGKINALTGKSWDEELHSEPQDYLVCPLQPWLDGINSGAGVIRQFVAMPLGEGYTVEGQLTGEEREGGVQVTVYDPLPGIFPDQPPAPKPFDFLPGGPDSGPLNLANQAQPAHGQAAPAMGLGAGGQITQKIYPDPYGLQTWDQSQAGRVSVFILNSQQYQAVTGEPLPPTPVSAKTYTEAGFPWFTLYNEHQGDLPAASALSGIQSVHAIDESSGTSSGEDESSIAVDDSQVKGIDLRE
jgi:hypothetical protein